MLAIEREEELINDLKTNWSSMDKDEKIKKVTILKKHYSYRELAKLLGKGKTTLWILLKPSDVKEIIYKKPFRIRYKTKEEREYKISLLQKLAKELEIVS